MSVRDAPTHLSSADIVRKHISQVKGGRLAAHAVRNGIEVLGLYLSDVVGDDLSSVASGPTCPDMSTFAEAVDIAKRFKIWDRLPRTIAERLAAGLAVSSLETPKPDDHIFAKVCNVLVGSADTSAAAAESYLKAHRETPFEQVSIFTNSLAGEARAFGAHLIGPFPVRARGGV